MTMQVSLVGYTKFEEFAGKDPWRPENTSGSSLVEFAGRACYQSWTRPNAATADNKGYIDHILSVEHGSVLEHASATLYIEGVSRSLTHELVRHRHLSPSQLSQRFVVIDQAGGFVTPPLLADNDDAWTILDSIWMYATDAYEELLEMSLKIAADKGMTGTLAKKAAREAARAVLPNMTPTAIVLTGNHRAWRHFLHLRATPQADAEIRVLAVRCWELLSDLEPNLYQDVVVRTDDLETGVVTLEVPSI